MTPTLLALVAVTQAILIAVLLVDRRRRSRADAQNRAVLSCVFADMALVTADAVVEWCNDNWLRSRSAANPFLSAARGEAWIQPPVDGTQQQPDHPRVRAALESVLSGAEAEHTLEYTWNDGARQRWSQLRICALRRPEGGAIIAHLDISGPKRVEEDARFVRHELAQQNLRVAMGEVVAGVAHELSQPLASSLGNAMALKRMLDNQAMVAEVAPIVEDIRGANTQASEIIRRIRSLMRKEPLDVQSIDFNAAVLEVVHVLKSSAEREGVLLTSHLNPRVPAITGDRVQLRQVAMNLILNAIEATRDSRVHRPTVHVSTTTDDCCVMLTVDDDGGGMPASDLSHVFEPYFTTKQDGLGVGLSISRSIVEAHGGSIRAENRPNAGARFVVVLPAA